MSSFRHIGTRHIHLDATDSTNNRAAEYAHDPSYAGIVISADIQSQGRGQHGRVWRSPDGANVLLSTLLFPPLQLQRPAVLTAFAAVVVAETILQVTGQQATIKWPNDVLVGGRKVCGILIEAGIARGARSVSFEVALFENIEKTAEPEAQREGDGVSKNESRFHPITYPIGVSASPSRCASGSAEARSATSKSVSEGEVAALAYASGSTEPAPHFILGVGLNVNLSAEDFESMYLPDATSLSIVTGRKLDVKTITQSLIRNLDEQYAALLDGGITALEECWAWRLGKTDRHATVELMDATELHGRVRRIAFDAVELEQATGEVRMLRPEEIRHLR